LKPVPRLIDRLIPDPAEREQAKLALAAGRRAASPAGNAGESVGHSGRSQFSPTRGPAGRRPTFLYVIYGVILLSVIGSIIGIWWPAEVFQAAENLSKLLNAVPESLWWLFGAGYLGYTSARAVSTSGAARRATLTVASTIQPIKTPSSSSAFPGRWRGRGLLSFVACAYGGHFCSIDWL
jgi:hypothetical protein